MGKYFKYAVGEILLVVIGILIALQINNWNTKNRTEINVRNYLVELNKEISSNLRYLNYIKEWSVSDMASAHKSLEILNTKFPDKIQDSSIHNLVGTTGPINWRSLETSTWEDFNSSGLVNQIQNEVLKKYVLRLKTEAKIFDGKRFEASETWNNQLLPYYKLHANVVAMRDSVGPYKLPKTYVNHNREAFINNREFNNIIMNRMMMLLRTELQVENIIERLDEVSTEIKEYTNND